MKSTNNETTASSWPWRRMFVAFLPAVTLFVVVQAASIAVGVGYTASVAIGTALVSVPSAIWVFGTGKTDKRDG